MALDFARLQAVWGTTNAIGYLALTSSEEVTTASSSFWSRDLFLRRKSLTDKISDQANEIAAREAIRLFIHGKVAPIFARYLTQDQ